MGPLIGEGGSERNIDGDEYSGDTTKRMPPNGLHEMGLYSLKTRGTGGPVSWQCTSIGACE